MTTIAIIEREEKSIIKLGVTFCCGVGVGMLSVVLLV